ncbi:MAG TPA: tetratricopeptide repeat protein [Chroococcales cyanobacterium]
MLCLSPNGAGVASDYEKLLKSAAEKGSSRARYLLEKIASLPPSKRLSAVEHDAESNNAEALAVVAKLYQTGLLKKHLDRKQSYSLYQRAAAKGSSDAEFELADSLVSGELTGEKNWKKAEPYLEAASKQGNSYAQTLLAAVYADDDPQGRRDDIVGLLTAAVKRGNPNAAQNLGSIYKQGELVKQDLNRAYELTLSAAKQGVIAAQTELFGITMLQRNSDHFEEALKWLKIAGNENNTNAMYILSGVNRFSGDEVIPDAETFTWLQKAASQNDQDALLELGSYYETAHESTPADPQKARKYYLQAAQNNETEAAIALGDSYRLEDNTAESDTEACKWYRRAAELGNLDAKDKVERHCSEKNSSQLH